MTTDTDEQLELPAARYAIPTTATFQDASTPVSTMRRYHYPAGARPTS
ncbi:hypothetical protein [Kitasatospora sp. NPDC088783]